MNPLAQIAISQKNKVTGSDSLLSGDQIRTKCLSELISQGAQLWEGSQIDRFADCQKLPDACVISTAIAEDNTELLYLKNQGVKILHRSDLLSEIARKSSNQVVVSGTHGKSTTTALLIWILWRAGVKASWLLGANFSQRRLPASHWMERDIFVYEGDESDQSFLKSDPAYSVITSLEPDHLENYDNSFTSQIEKFQQFALSTQKKILCNISCPNVQKHIYQNIPQLKDKIITYGKQESNADWQLNESTGELIYQQQIFQLELSNLPGSHNLLNAVAAIALASELGVELRESLKCLRSFPGLHRRFELIGGQEGITLYDDYAHHPSEIKASISTARELLGDKGRLLVLFQPHLSTRLRDLWEEFTRCFTGADILLIADLYQARGKPIEGINSRELVEQIKHRAIFYCARDICNLIEKTSQLVQTGDLVLILGAGNITLIRDDLLKAFPVALPLNH